MNQEFFKNSTQRKKKRKETKQKKSNLKIQMQLDGESDKIQTWHAELFQFFFNL